MMPLDSKVIILISSCARDRSNGAQDAARDTWIREWRKYMRERSIEYRFVLGDGNGNRPASDELIVDAPDDYHRLWYKNRAAWDYCMTPDSRYDTDFKFVLQCCVDTYVKVPVVRRLVDFIGSHYMGVPCLDGHVGGGFGYFLDSWSCSKLRSYKGPIWMHEDVTTHHILTRNGIQLHALKHGEYSEHLSKDTGVYDPQWMHDCHKKYLEELTCLTSKS